MRDFTIKHDKSILYNAGPFAANFNKSSKLYSTLSPEEQAMHDANEYDLESYHYIHKGGYVKRIRKDGVKVFLDSGAFTAYTQNAKIDIGKYVDFCFLNRDIILFPSVLDVIDFNDSKASTKGTYKNQMEMERRFREGRLSFADTGAGPLPVAHYGEADEVVKWYADNYSYMALGGLVPVATPQMILWLDHIFERILCNPDGTPRVKVHGFGVTSLPVMQRYCWHSVDSTTWIRWALNGFILHPVRGVQLNISSSSSARKIKGQHIDNLAPRQREVLEKELLELEIDTQRLRDVYASRWAFNLWAFPHFLSLRGFAKRFIRTQPGLF